MWSKGCCGERSMIKNQINQRPPGGVNIMRPYTLPIFPEVSIIEKYNSMRPRRGRGHQAHTVPAMEEKPEHRPTLAFARSSGSGYISMSGSLIAVNNVNAVNFFFGNGCRYLISTSSTLFTCRHRSSGQRPEVPVSIRAGQRGRCARCRPGLCG